MTAKPASPYKGLSAFDDSELDALLFFGREREREIVAANLIASRLTVLYGPSGVGKSSLLRAAVARSLRELPEEPLVLVFSRWNDDPASALASAIGSATGVGGNGSALELLEQAQSDRDLYLILDQTEEYFLYHADDAGFESFADALPALLTAPYRINVLVSIREDSLAKLDRFTGRIPGLFANTLRLDRLDREAARAAIVRPVERYAELTGTAVGTDPELVERVLDEAGTGRIEPALGGVGAVDESQDSRIEAPYLQLVMQRLWEEERAAGSNLLRAETLERLGGAERIVEEHLHGALDELTSEEKEIAARLFNHLVTPSGTKIAHEVSDLAEFGRISSEELRPILTTLTERRILRSVDEGAALRYEIFHDVLAQPVLAWRTAHVADRELRRQKDDSDRRHRRLLAIIAVGGALLAAMTATSVYALSKRSEAQGQAREATAHQLEALSAASLPIEPERSLLLAREAARLAPTATAEEALRSALLSSRVRVVVEVGEPLLGAVWADGAVLAATESGSLVVAEGATGDVLRKVESGTPARRVSFAEDGSALFTSRDGTLALVRADGSIRKIPSAAGVLRAEISADGSLAVLLDRAGGRLVDVETGEVERTFEHRGAVSAAISRDNRRIATGAADDTIRVWTRRGTLLQALEQEGSPAALAFGNAGASVASAGTDGLARIWQSVSGRLSTVLEGDATGLTDVGFSTDGSHLVTSSEDGTVRVSNADVGATLVVLNGHRERVTSAAFTGPAGSSVVTASRDGTARVWDALFQPELEELARLPTPVSAIEVAGGRLRVTTADGRLHVLEADTGDEITSVAGRERERVAFGPDGASARIRLNTVVLRTDGTRTLLEGHRDRVRSVEFSPEGALLATASRDQTVRIWDAETGETLVTLQHNSEVRDASFSPDGRWVVTAAFRAALWDPRSGLNVVRLQGHEGPVTAATFDSSGKTIVTGGVDGTVRRYACVICGKLDELVALADERLAATGRELTEEERERYLG